MTLNNPNQLFTSTTPTSLSGQTVYSDILPVDPPSTLPFATLPTILKNSVQMLTNRRERELLTISILVALSGVMTKVKGVYGQREYYPNLFFMVLASAASGKGVMMYAKELIQEIHSRLLLDSQEAQLLYEKTNSSNRTLRPSSSRPPLKVGIIPANCSTSKLMEHLVANSPDTPQVMIESEMDTLSTATASEWGNFSDILRKVFQNEPATLSRKGNNSEYLEVTTPKMSVLLSGTPGQIVKLINNNEDGLFSRFLVMTFQSDPKWTDVSPCPGCMNLTELYKEQSKEYVKLWEFLSTQEFIVELKESQWREINKYGDSKNFQIYEEYGPNASSVVRRHGLMLFKLCMVLSGMRAFEEQTTTSRLVCREEDFVTALFLVDRSLESSLEIFNFLPSAPTSKKDNQKQRLYQLLPMKFKRREAIEISVKEKISERSTDRWLQEFVRDQMLSQHGQGEYVKIVAGKLANGEKNAFNNISKN